MYGVVPTAGRGTRLGSLTAEQPKGLVDVACRPLLAYVFETLLESGVTDLVVVVGYKAEAIRDHFGDSFAGVPITYAVQDEQLGLGHAVLQAAPHVDGPFVVLNGDNVVSGALAVPLETFQESAADAVIAVERVSREQARKTGVVSTADAGSSEAVCDSPQGSARVTSLVEKPADPPSRLVTTGCFVLPESVFAALDSLDPSNRGEYELTDGIDELVHAGSHVTAIPLSAKRVNVNTPSDVDRAAEMVHSRR